MIPARISGKEKGLEALANSRGIIAALALDQRSALRTLFARAMNADTASIPTKKLIEFKAIVSTILTPYASSILLDPELGLPAAQLRAETAGLLLAYEQTGYDKNINGRLPRLLENWSVRRLVDAGANGIKVLLYYSNASAMEVKEQKNAFVEKVGAECAAAEIPFFLELVSYREGMDEKGLEFARVKPEVVAAGIEQFSNPRYRVDVLKVGMPVNLGFVQGSPATSGGVLHTREEAKHEFLRVSKLAQVPFIYLSEGVSNATFQFGLELAGEAKAKFSGVLCGRATWKDGVAVFVNRGRSALEEWLGREGIQNIEAVNKCINGATPWFAFRKVSGD
jgi:tagatose 1,6-diphosphate aldolase